MATEAERAMWARLDALTKERDALLAKVAPLEAKKEAACIARNEANTCAENLANQINKIIFPRMRELMSELGMVSRALSHKTRP